MTRTIFQLTLLHPPRAKPTPIIDDIDAYVVDIGNPHPINMYGIVVYNHTIKAFVISAEKLLISSNLVILYAAVSITLHPSMKPPRAIPILPIKARNIRV